MFLCLSNERAKRKIMSKKYAALHTLHIVSIGANGQYSQKGCGCVMKFRNQLFLLSVAHIQSKTDVALHLILHNDPRLESLGLGNHYKLDPTKFKKIGLRYPLWLCKVIAKVSRFFKKNPIGVMFKEKEHYDFFYDILKLPSNYPIVLNIPQNSPYYGQLHEKFEYKPFSFDKNGCYCIYGLKNFQSSDHGHFLCEDFFEDDLKYLKEEKGFLIFEMAGATTALKGCSGAPIIDSNGNLVSLLVKLHKKKNMICGVDLRRFVQHMHIAVNEITGEEIYE